MNNYEVCIEFHTDHQRPRVVDHCVIGLLKRHS